MKRSANVAVHGKKEWPRPNRYGAIKMLAGKVRGVSMPKPEAEPDPQAKARESGEQSYVGIAAHLKNFNDRLEALGTYTPPDSEIGI